MKNFDSRRVEFLIEHKINVNVMKQWNKQQTDKLDNLIIEYLIYYLTI